MNRILLLSFLFSISVFADVDCNKHKIYCQIKKNSPKMPYKRAMKLSNIIYKAAKKYKIPANIYTAILKQESNYHLEAKGCHKGIMSLNADDGIAMAEVKICSDFGISQIYYKTAIRYGLNISSLVSDLEYSVMAGAKVLAGFKKYSKKDPDWFTRYNCGSRGTTKRDTCQIYKKLISRYL